MPSETLVVDPGRLRLPPSRRHGADPAKLLRQLAKYGQSVQAMPPLWVSRDKNGELMILDGVTRATRVAKYIPGQTVTVEVTEEESHKDYSRLPTVADRLP